MNNEFDPENYVTVRDRVLAFKADFPRRAVQTEILRDDGNVVVVKATVWPDCDQPDCYFTGHAEEDRRRGEVNAGGSALENCETSAVGRALAFLGYPVTRRRDAETGELLSEPTRRTILALCAGLRLEDDDRDALIREYCSGQSLGGLTERRGKRLIERLKGHPQGQPRRTNVA